jgi:PAS domain S-box-containing protein
MKRIMLVDDEAIITMQLEKRLSSMGYAVVGVASSGEQSISMARRLLPDLVLMDIVMPGSMDGIEAASKIRSELDIPIVFLTAFADEGHIHRAKKADPFGYIVKPFHEKEVFASIEVALHKREVERRFRDDAGMYRAIMDGAFDPILVYDAGSRILDINERAVKLLGWERALLLGEKIDMLFPDGGKKRQRHFEEVAARGFGCMRNAEIRGRSGQCIRVDVSESTVSYAGNCAVLMILSDRKSYRTGLRHFINRRMEADAAPSPSRDGVMEPGISGLVSEPRTREGDYNADVLPLCTSCKRVRTPLGHWIRLESFFKSRYNLDFSHGICSECAHSLWPEMPQDLEDRNPG